MNFNILSWRTVGLPALLTCLLLLQGCTGISSLQSPIEPAFYIGHQGDVNPVWFRAEDSATASPMALPSALTNVRAGDIARLSIPDVGERLYIVASSLGALAIVDVSTSTARMVAMIPVGANPAGLAIDQSASFAYVSVSGDHRVNVVDLDTNRSVGTVALPSGCDPRGIALTPNGQKLYVACNGTGIVHQIDPANRTLTSTISMAGRPTNLAIGPNGEDLYVARTGISQVSVVDTLTSTISTNVVGLQSPQGVTVDDSGATLFVSEGTSGAGGVSLYDSGSFIRQSGPFATASRPVALLALNEDSFLSANLEANSVTQRYTGTLTPTLKNIAVGRQPISLAVIRTVDRTARPILHRVSANPESLEVRVDGVAFTGPRNFTWAPNTTHQLAVTTPQNAATGSDRWVFQNWTGSDSSTANPFTVIARAQGGSYTANFQRFCQLNLTVVGPGTITANPPATDGYYLCGSSVSLTATPAAGNRFVSWSGDLSGVTSPTVLLVDNEKSVTATFAGTDLTPVTLQTTPLPLPLQFGANPPVPTPATERFAPGTTIRLVAPTPQLAGGSQYRFLNWLPGGETTPAISPLVAASAITYTANYQLECHVLTLTASPANGGTFTTSPAAANNCYSPGTTVTIVASPVAAGNAVLSWTGTATNSGNTATVVMSTPRTVTANFGPAPSVAHTITTSPAGLQVTVDGTTAMAPRTVSWPVGSTRTLSVPSPQVNGAGTIRNTFTGWQPAVAASVVAPAVPTTFIANFTTAYRVTINVSGGCGLQTNVPGNTFPTFVDGGTAFNATFRPPTGSFIQSVAVNGVAVPITPQVGIPYVYNDASLGGPLFIVVFCAGAA